MLDRIEPDPREFTHSRLEVDMRILLTALLLISVPMAHIAAAQTRPPVNLEFAAGSLLFPDDGIVNEGFVGAHLRMYLSPRVSVGPEIAYVSGERHNHLMLTGNLTYDFLSPLGARPRPVTPFVVVGGGLFQTRENFFNGPFTSHEGAFTAGGGVRGAIGDRVTVGAEARIGWELHVRANGFVGVRLGR
jgi:hypothetical protein